MAAEIQSNVHIPANPYHRKIDLQSAGDLSYLHQNLLKAADDKLDLHFPPSAAFTASTLRNPAAPAVLIPLGASQQTATTVPGETTTPSTSTGTQQAPLDPLREKVRSLVNSFITRTYDAAKLNITLNGLDVPTVSTLHPHSDLNLGLDSTAHPDTDSGVSAEIEGRDFTYTPYDARLQEKVAKLYAEVELLTGQVARLRRDAPKRGASMYGEALEGKMRDDERRWEVQAGGAGQGSRKRKRERGHDGDEEARETGDAGVEALHGHDNQEDGGADEHPDVDADAPEYALTLEPQRDNWNEDVQRVYAIGQEELARLVGKNEDQRGGSLTETTGRVQRARLVVGELE